MFTLDTGAKGTELSSKYYATHKQEIEEKGTLTRSQHGGAGGIMDVEFYSLKDFPFTIGTQSCTLQQIPVMLTEFSFNKDFDGNMGQDIFTQFEEMILNFESMYLAFR